MINKKGQANDTAILIGIFVFQAFLIMALRFLNVNTETQEVGSEDISFTSNIVTNIILLGWFNAILFTPLLAGVTYIIAKLIRGGG